MVQRFAKGITDMDSVGSNKIN